MQSESINRINYIYIHMFTYNFIKYVRLAYIYSAVEYTLNVMFTCHHHHHLHSIWVLRRNRTSQYKIYIIQAKLLFQHIFTYANLIVRAVCKINYPKKGCNTVCCAPFLSSDFHIHLYIEIYASNTQLQEKHTLSAKAQRKIMRLFNNIKFYWKWHNMSALYLHQRWGCISK